MKRNLKGKKVVVTGYTGYVGRHLIKELIKQGAIVYGISRSAGNIKENIKVFRADISNNNEVLDILNKIQPKAIFHTAAYGVVQSESDIFKAIDINIKGTVNLIEAAKNINDFEIFVNTGSEFEYGNRQNTLHEKMSLEPTSEYSSSKAATTIIAHQLCSSYEIPIVTLRLFSIYGGIENKNRFIPYIIHSALSNKEVNLTSCEQIRDYVYIDDIINSYICAYVNFSNKNEIINVSTMKPITLKEIVKMIKELVDTNFKVNIGALQNRKNEMWKLVGENIKAENLIGWYPKTDMISGLKKTIKLYRETYNYEK